MNDPFEDFASRKARGHRFVALTAYDYVFGRLLDDAGLDFILVGDSLGMVALGQPDTTGVTLADMEHHVRATAAGVSKTPLVADLPRATFDSSGAALESAGRLLEAGAHGVKIEGGRDFVPQVAALVGAGVPVVGHLGMLPQRVREEGGYRIKGRTPEEAGCLLDDARALDGAGVRAIVAELVVAKVADALSAAVNCPVLGIGSGPGCDGQILVTHDLVGFFPWFRPRFVTPRAALAETFLDAVQAHCASIRETPRSAAGVSAADSPNNPRP
jgi:3-methyl-2-oxobutanoate hydroxymethyltransferase